MVAVTMEKVNASECQVDFDSLITMPEALPENPACREDSQANFVRASITVQLPNITSLYSTKQLSAADFNVSM